MAKMGFMKSAAEVLTGNGKPSLRAYLHTRMTGLRSPRSIMRIHASELTKPDTYCPRETSLHLITGRDRPDDYINTCLQYTFDLGDALHDLLRDTWARDIVFGDWRCKHCDKRYYQTRYPKSCTGCGRSRFMYEEVRFKSLVSGASGGLDLLVKLPGVDKLVIVEAKTIKHDDWKVLKAPQAEHELRTNYYMRLVDESDNNLGEFIDTEQALVIYMTKGYGGKDPTLADSGIMDSLTPFKEWWVKRNDKATDVLNVRATATNNFINQGTVPEGVCPSIHCPRAKKCIMRKECFSDLYPAGSVHKLIIGTTLC